MPRTARPAGADRTVRKRLTRANTFETFVMGPAIGWPMLHHGSVEKPATAIPMFCTGRWTRQDAPLHAIGHASLARNLEVLTLRQSNSQRPHQCIRAQRRNFRAKYRTTDGC